MIAENIRLSNLFVVKIILGVSCAGGISRNEKPCCRANRLCRKTAKRLGILWFFFRANDETRNFLTLQSELRTKEPSIGQIAQSVEQRTENPRVGGSIPSLATT